MLCSVRSTGILDSRLNDTLDRLVGNQRSIEIIIQHAQLALALDKVVVLIVNKHSSNHITEVLVALVDKRVGKEVIDAYHPAIRAAGVLMDIRRLHHLMVARELEDIGVHAEHQHIAPETHLELEIAVVLELKQDGPAFVVGLLLEEFDKAFGGAAEQFESLLRIVKHLLFQRSLVENKLFQ